MTRNLRIMIIAIICGLVHPTFVAAASSSADDDWAPFAAEVRRALESGSVPKTLCDASLHDERYSPDGVRSAMQEAERVVVHRASRNGTRAVFTVQLDYAEILDPRWVWLLASHHDAGWKIDWITVDRGAVRSHLRDSRYSPQPVPPPRPESVSPVRELVEDVCGITGNRPILFFDRTVGREAVSKIRQWAGRNLRGEQRWEIWRESVEGSVANVRVCRWVDDAMVNHVRDVSLRKTDDGWKVSGVEPVRTPRLLDRAEIRGVYADLGTRWVVETRPGNYQVLSTFAVPPISGEAALIELARAVEARSEVRDRLVQELIDAGQVESRHATRPGAKKARDCRSSFVVREVPGPEWVVLDAGPAYTDPQYEAAKLRVSVATGRLGWSSFGSHAVPAELILGQ